MTSHQNHNFLSPLRYPGGKGALSNFVKEIVSANALLDGDYAEVYAGGAGIAWALLFEEYVRRVHINDLNSSVIAFWRSIFGTPEELCQLIQDTPVTMEQWHRQRAIQMSPQDYSPLELGFSTFFLNRTNRSGIINGGVIGGKNQNGKWKMDSRYNKVDLIRRIKRLASYANRVRVYELDAADFIKNVLRELPQRTIVYLDPPYYHKGQELYENHYNKADHAGIAALVSHEIHHPWIVSYDAAPEILELYSTHPHIRYKISYSAQDRYEGTEVIFYSRFLRVPQVPNPTAVGLPILKPGRRTSLAPANYT